MAFPSRLAERVAAQRRGWLAVALVALLPVPSWADDVRATTLVSVDGGGLLFANQVSLDFEQALGTAASIFVAPGALLAFIPPSAFPSQLDGLWGGSLSLGARFYVMGSAPRGLFLGPVGAVGWGHLSGNGQEIEGFYFSGGAVLGFNLLVAERLLLSAGIGAAYRREELVTGANRVVSQGVVPLSRLAIGIGF